MYKNQSQTQQSTSNGSKGTKQCFFAQNNIKYVDYKDTEIHKKFLNPHGRILSRKKTGVSARSQRQLALAIKRARFLGLLPYIAR